MAIPSVNMFSNEPGGGLNVAMRANNSLANENILRQINQIKKQYLPLTSQADAASKLAYANLMGPQFLAKLLQNPGAIANMGDPAAAAALQKAVQAGMGQGTGLNYLNNLQQSTGVGQPSTNNFVGFVKNAFKNLIGQGQKESSNPFAQAAQIMPTIQQQSQQATPIASSSMGNIPRPKDGVTLEGEQWYNAKGEPVYADDEETSNAHPMELELVGGKSPQKTPSWAENTGKFEGLIKEGEELGKFRADTLNEIGHNQLQLSNTGANVDRLINDFTSPEFITMRETFPMLQDTQLKVLSHTGSPEQREMIGKIIGDIESFKGATVMGFKGQTLKREFEYADKLKPTTSDTVYTALGKLETLKALKEIAYEKNKLINRYIKNQKMDLTDAVEKADKELPIKDIEQRVKYLTQPTITLRNKNNGSYITVTKARAKELGVPNV